MAHEGFEFNQSFGSRRPSDLGDSLGRGAFVFILGFVYFGLFVDQIIMSAGGASRAAVLVPAGREHPATSSSRISSTP